MPLEAQACGRPVVPRSRRRPGDGIAGEIILVEEPMAEAFAAGIAEACSRPFDAVAIRRHAERFSRTRFGDEMQNLIADAMRTNGPRAC